MTAEAPAQLTAIGGYNWQLECATHVRGRSWQRRASGGSAQCFPWTIRHASLPLKSPASGQELEPLCGAFATSVSP